VYDTQLVTRQNGTMLSNGTFAPGGYKQTINANSAAKVADCAQAITQLAQTCPNVEWVSVVVCWFATSTNIASCQIFPGVEYKQGGHTTPEQWQVAGYNRATAYAIGYEGSAPRYGGTPSDQSILRMLATLRSRGYKIAFYPMVMVDQPGKPWRGHITGAAANVANFFTRMNGYNRFINHYATLCAGKVDAFVIGSEMKGLTSISASAGVYPAVSQFVTVAANVRSIMGSSVLLTYAADWSEYHHAPGGWYNMDALWASPNINMVGIDAYFPLTDSAEDAQDLDAIRAGWTSGEGWDWYYTNEARTTKAPLEAPYAWKNIEWWWKNQHIQPNDVQTAWLPQSKPIWFMEIGFPSVDGASNQPNVFYDPESLDGGLPRLSRGSMDLRAQRMAMQATLEQWLGSTMVQRMFWWTWDARPYPQWPDRRDLWSDGKLWAYGHWLQGKLGVSHAGALVQQLCRRAGLNANQVDVSALNFQMDGIAITEYGSVREVLETLQQAYFFDLVDSGDKLIARPRAAAGALTVQGSALLPLEQGSGHTLEQIRTQELELPARVEVQHISRVRQFEAGVQRAMMPSTDSSMVQALSLPIALSDAQAYLIAQTTLTESWLQRRQLRLQMNAQALMLEPGDRLMVEGDAPQRLRVLSTRLIEGYCVEVEAVADDPSLYPESLLVEDEVPPAQLPSAPVPTHLLLADLPNMPMDNVNDTYLFAACAAEARDWRGAEIWRTQPGASEPQLLGRQTQSAIIGMAIDVLANGPHTVWDEASSVTIQLLGEEGLSTTTHDAVLAGANIAVLGKELLQFREAEHLGDNLYRLSGLLRGRLGTEDAIAAHEEGDAFVLLNPQVQRFPQSTAMIGIAQQYQVPSVGMEVSEAPSQRFIWRARGLMPYAPAHLRVHRLPNNDIRIQWVRRTRGGGEWRDGVDIPLHEEREAYRLSIWSADGNTRLREWETNNQSQIYSVANQIADFGVVTQTALRVRVVQLSAIAGEGVPQALLVPIETMPN
jgi:hypothetical protein